MKKTRSKILSLFIVTIIFLLGMFQICNAQEASTVKTGGVLTVAIDSEPMQLDPHLVQQTLVISINDLFHDFLWRWDKDFKEFIPKIAEKWEWIDDTNLLVNVRKGIKFHNGRELVANDIKYSIDRILDPQTASPWAAYLEPIQEVKIIDDYSLTIQLKNPWWGLMDRLSSIAIIPKEAVEEFGDLKTHPIGCGPFVFNGWDSGIQIKAKKSTDYYIENQPYLDEIILKFMPVYNTAKSALLTGDVDLIVWPDPSDLESLQANKDFELFKYSQMAIMYVNFNTKSKYLDNKLIRKAISLVLDRDAFNTALYKGQGEVGWSPILKTQNYYSKDWEYEKNIEEAKKLMSEAGYPDGGFKLRILALKGAEEIMGEVIYSNLADIGIQGEIEVAEIPEALDRMLKKEDFDISGLGDLISPDPDFFASKYLLSDGQMAALTGHWDNAEVRKLIEEGRSTLDEAKRAEIYKRIYDITLDENPMVFVAYPVRFPVYRTYLKNFFVSGDMRYNWSEMWLDK